MVNIIHKTDVLAHYQVNEETHFPKDINISLNIITSIYDFKKISWHINNNREFPYPEKGYTYKIIPGMQLMAKY